MTTPKKAVAATQVNNTATPAVSPKKSPSPRKSGNEKGTISFAASKTRSKFLETSGGFDTKLAPALKPKKSVVSARHAIVAEFYLGAVCLLFSDTSAALDKSSEPTQIESRWTQLAAFILVWVVLFGLTSFGAGSARLAAALGGLIVLTLYMKRGFNPFDVFAGISIAGAVQGAVDDNNNAPPSHTAPVQGNAGGVQRKPITS